MSRNWRIELDRDWDVLGPFPVHAREQHFLSPSYPLDLILATTQHPTSLTHTAYTEWSRTTADPHGIIHVAHPSIPWHQIRATEGWAGLQHLNVLRGRLFVYPPSDHSSDPLLRTELLQGAFFTILPPPDSAERKTHVPEWHYGNIYTLERAPVQLVRFPVSPARNGERTTYEVFICAPYEIRLFGDPSSYSSPHPILTLNFSVSLQFPHYLTPSPETDSIQYHVADAPLQHTLAHSITPHIVDGTPFGDAVGVGVQCLDFERWDDGQLGYWSVVHAHLAPASARLATSLSMSLFCEASVRVAPTQTRVIPLRLYISPHERISEDVKQLVIDLTCLPSTAQLTNQKTFILRVTLPLIHVPLWTHEEHTPIQASYFFAKSMPTVFSVKPPKEAFGDFQAIPDKFDTKSCNGNEPILALHGAGVDILSKSFWAGSLPRQKYAWVVIPQGRTAWGFDWHGPSAADAFATVPALSRILSTSGSGRWAKWGFDAHTRFILMGHSNGGQGTWYMASRWPDRVSGIVAAAGYIKSQAYVSWSMSRFAHFIDPSLRAVLDSSLTPDDNDLFLGNLVGKPVLALHGGADDNVPPWQTREQVGILKTWDRNADVTYHEDSGQPHWYPDVLCNDRVQAFLDRIYFPSSSPRSATQGLANQERKTTDFTLTVSIPAESGSLNGWQIHALTTPGLLGRLRVMSAPNGDVSVRSTNVAAFSFKSGVWASAHDGVHKMTVFVVDGDNINIDLSEEDDIVLFVKVCTGIHPAKPHWKILPHTATSDPLQTTHRLCTPPQRLQSILSTHTPLTLLVPSLTHSPKELSAALRIAHALQLFHALDARIVAVPKIDDDTVPAADSDIYEGNMVIIGCAESPLVQRWLTQAGGMWSYVDGAWHLNRTTTTTTTTTTRFDRPSSAILFCQPHPYDAWGLALFLQSTDSTGLERAVRLFPIRTGVLSPDWLVVDGRADTIGAAGVQGAGVYGWTAPLDAQGDYNTTTTGKWVWNERMSWLD